MQEQKYRIPVTVKEDDLDELNHVNNVRYVKWMEDVARAHWSHLLQKNNLKNNYIWVVASHFIEYKRSAILGHKLSLETYIESFEDSICYRIIEIKNAVTGKVMIQSRSKWCMIDFKTKRPTLIPDEVLNLVKVFA